MNYSWRDCKDIDSIENEEGVEKYASLKTLEYDVQIFLSNLPIEVGQIFFIFHVRGVKKISVALREGFKICVISFQIRPPPTAGS